VRANDSLQCVPSRRMLPLVALVMLYTPASFPFVAANHVFILWAWSGAFLTIAYWQRLRQERENSLRAAELAREAQLEMLRYQINPHFLFNAMGSLRALVAIDTGRATTAITQLAEFLRYSLNAQERRNVEVEEELCVLLTYLAIEKIRFEERLQVHVDVSEDARRRTIPSLLLHPLVENAVHHGVPSEGELEIWIAAGIEGEALWLEVRNTGQLAPESSAERIGLRNVRERLAVCYPARHKFELSNGAGIVRAFIRIDEGASNRG